MLRPRVKRRRAAVLILVLGILALLTFVAAAFQALTTVETRATSNYRDGERARYGALSGIEATKFNLRRSVYTPGFPVIWAQPDQYDYSQNAWLENDFFTAPSTAYAGYPGGYLPPVSIAPDAVEHGKAPSFGLALNPVPGVLNDSTTGTSGPPRALPWPSYVFGSTYYTDPTNKSFKGDYASVRVTPATAQLYLNDTNPCLANMLETLAEIVIPPTGTGGVPVGAGKAIVDSRPANGYARATDLEGLPALKNLGLSITQIQALEPYVCCLAPVDKKVIARWDTTNNHSDITLRPRAPVDVNWAPYPVLVAVLCPADVNGGVSVGTAGLKGATISHGTATLDYTTACTLAKNIMKYRSTPQIQVDSPLPPLAAQPSWIAGMPSPATGVPSTLCRRFGFRRWAEFVTFLQTPAMSGLSASQAALVAANCNPNTDLNKFVPDASNLREVDKSDVQQGSTEFCFSPGGVFTIDSFGVVLGPDATIAASARVRAVVRVFEQYVETTQADFEDDRIDPEGLELSAMRDICTLPECRNAIDPAASGAAGPHLRGNVDFDFAQTGLFAATYDGQLTFNVITKCICAQAENGTYVGFIDRTANGKRATGASTTAGGITQVAGSPVRPYGYDASTNKWVPAPPGSTGYTPVGPGPMVVLPPGATGGGTQNPLANPDWNSGSDMHPLAAITGRSQTGGGSPRAFAFTQDENNDPASNGVLNPTHQSIVAKDVFCTDQLTLTGTAGVVASIWIKAQATIGDIEYDSCDTQSFEAWFKPAWVDTAGTQTLLEWESGEPVYVPAAPPTGESARDFLPPPPQDGHVNNADITAVASLSAIANLGFTSRARNDYASLGVHASLKVWIDMPASTAADPSGLVHCEFKLTTPTQSDSSGSGPDVQPAGTPYSRSWVSTNKIFPGTWHHFLFSLQRPDDLAKCASAANGGVDHTWFYVDGNTGTPSGDDTWPTEISADARLVKMSLDRMSNEIYDFEQACFNLLLSLGAIVWAAGSGPVRVDTSFYRPQDHRDPCVIPIGDSAHPNIYVAQADGGGTPFKGLIDNIVFDSKWKRIGGGGGPLTEVWPGEQYLARYDCFRPSSDNDTTINAASDAGAKPKVNSLLFSKRTQAVEWDRPIRIVGYETTAWKSQRTSDEGSAELGHVHMRFGWAPLPTGGTTSSGSATPGTEQPLQGFASIPLSTGAGIEPATGLPAGSPVAGTNNNGWTGWLDQNAPFNGVTNGYVVMSTDPVTSAVMPGFQTQGPYQFYGYALEVLPISAANIGDSSAFQSSFQATDGPKMAPVIDDVTITYMPWDTATVFEEEEVVD